MLAGNWRGDFAKYRSRIEGTKVELFCQVAFCKLSAERRFTPVLILIFGAGMFVSSGDDSNFIIKLSKFCFIFWIPLLVIGITLILISVILSGFQSSRIKKL